MTSVDEAPNYVRVVPEKGSAEEKRNAEGSPDETPHARPRAGARDGRSVTGQILAAGSKIAARRVAARTAMPAEAPAEERPDPWRRAPLSLAEVTHRLGEQVSEAWDEDRRARAIWVAVFGSLVAVPLSAIAYGIAFCSQRDYRAGWLALAIACVIAAALASQPSEEEPAPGPAPSSSAAVPAAPALLIFVTT